SATRAGAGSSKVAEVKINHQGMKVWCLRALVVQKGVAGAFGAAPLVTILVTSREARSVNLSEVSEAGFLEVMRALGIVALVFLAIRLSGLEAIFVRLIGSLITVVKHVL